ncbi:30S ribosomal protein S8 [Candidatus Gracilibacteria bacterium]|nr:30S ribosomal protein S8 [Candidatus Gracilibacteria bacterium]
MTYVNAPVHDLLIRIKNAYMAHKLTVEGVVYSNFKIKILELLKQYGFVKNFEVIEDGKKRFIKVSLKAVENPVDDIPEVKFYSKPSRPWYVSYKDIKSVAGGKGIGIISTNQGLMSTHVAKKKKVGGELIAEIY